MNSITTIGILAASCTTGAFLPQVIRTLRTRDTNAISLFMYVIFSTGVALWLLYGLFKSDFPIIIANGITLMLALAVLILKIKHG